MLLRALMPIVMAASGCTASIPDDTRPSPVPMVTSDVFVLDRDQHLICLSDCIEPDPDPDATYRSVRGEGSFSCAVRTDDTAECWGPRDFGDLVPDERFRDATAHLGQACGITDAGEVLCWGDDGQAVTDNAPAGPWDQIETTRDGGYCVWSTDGAVGCFHPRQAADLAFGYETFRVIGQKGCGLVGDGQVDCFSGNSSYQAPRHFVKSMDLAAYYECVLMMETRVHKEGTLICTGDEANPEGQFTQLAMHAGHGCVVTDDDEVLCWGGDWEPARSFGTFP